MFLVLLFVSFVAVYIPIFPITQAQRTYNCATREYCNDYVDIDLRIQTPNSGNNPNPTPTPSGNCPQGYIPCTNIKCGFSTQKPVFGSNGQATQGAYPWHVYLYRIPEGRNAYVGGGVLINQYWVLTAAHKVQNYRLQPNNIGALLGLYNRNDAGPTVQNSALQNIILHPSYDTTAYKPSYKNDIALLRLQTPMNFGNYVNLACLPAARSYVGSSAQNCVVVGFGQTTFANNDAPYTYLKQAFVPIVTIDECNRTFYQIGIETSYYLDGQNEICAGGQANVDACTQDGGSGLVCRDSPTGVFSVVGLVIWGKNCGVQNRYGVYVNVPSYLGFISKYVR